MSDTPVRIDDLNLARLNLISALDQNDEGKRDWKVRFEMGDRIVNVSCTALPEYGIPHGIDNDVNVALLAFFHERGQPADGVLEISASELMQMCGFHRNGDYYERLKQSLKRLHTTSFEVSGGWRDHPNRRWTTASFHIVTSLTYTSREGGPFDDRTVIRVKLADEIVASVLGGYTKALNIEFMRKLSRPRTRILFRLLDAARVDPEQPDDIVDQFDVGLLEWADQCKIPRARPDAVRRALEGPHQELIRNGYLRQVTYVGRGAQQRIQYEFSADFMPMSPALLERFRKHGVTDGVARQFARTHSASVLMRQIDVFENLVATGQLVVRKTPAAALVHLLKNPDQYQHAGLQAKPGKPDKAKPVKAAAEDPSSAHQSLEAEFAGMSPEARADATLRYLKLYFPTSLKLGAGETDILREAVRSQALDGYGLVHAALHAMTSLQGQVFVDELRAHLKALQDQL